MIWNVYYVTDAGLFQTLIAPVGSFVNSSANKKIAILFYFIIF